MTSEIHLFNDFSFFPLQPQEAAEIKSIFDPESPHLRQTLIILTITLIIFIILGLALWYFCFKERQVIAPSMYCILFFKIFIALNWNYPIRAFFNSTRAYLRIYEQRLPNDKIFNYFSKDIQCSSVSTDFCLVDAENDPFPFAIIQTKFDS